MNYELKVIGLVLVFIAISLFGFSQEIPWYKEVPKPTKWQWFNFNDAYFDNCEFKGQKMGGVRVELTHITKAKYRVKIVRDHEDLTVRYVTTTSQNSSCGDWQIVEYGSDFSIAIVDNQEDFTIRITED
jgi:hypothetical protein